ncbi:TIGR02186 family protein [Celeribacter marinus]|uniref:TIGR02186 family protein n=1 Tax=Celeribacter marinus TaxID=1397108 RepID=UPI003173A2B1
MMRFAPLVFLISLLAPCAAHAEQVVAALSQNRISITANFDGSEILIYGAVKRDTPTPDDGPLDVIITVAGPQKVETIRRKDRRLGIWINVENTIMGHAPTFYEVASTRALSDTLTPLTDSLWKITPDAQILPAMRGAPARDALLRLRTADELYRVRENDVEITQDTLFSTSVTLPSNLVEGSYTTRILLLREGRVLDSYTTSINVQKVGIERWLYRLAQDNAFLYGLLALLIAGLSGWLASAGFRLLKR